MAFFRQLRSGRNFSRRGGLIHIDFCADRSRIALAGQRFNRNIKIIRVPQPFRPVGVSIFHCLHHTVDIGRTIMPHVSQVPALKNIQHLHNMYSARGRRRHSDNFYSAKCTFNWGAVLDSVGFQVSMGDQAASRFHRSNQLIGNPAFIKTGCPVRGDSFERFRKIRLAQYLTCMIGAAISFIEISSCGSIALQTFLIAC